MSTALSRQPATSCASLTPEADGTLTHKVVLCVPSTQAQVHPRL